MIKTLLDSGAYGAFTSRTGERIDLTDYIAFIHRFDRFLDLYINLDIIAGTRGKSEFDPEKIEIAAKQSYQNLQTMKNAGLRPIPVFHQGENLDWLRRCLDDGEPYIALSPYKKQGRVGMMTWLDQCFDTITENGRPLVKTHGLGVTSPLMLHRYPWATVDSTRWFRAAMCGELIIPIYVNGIPDYTAQPDVVLVTDQLRHQRRHFDNLDEFDRDRVRRFLDDELGVDVAAAQRTIGYRHRLWARYFMGLQVSCASGECSPSLKHASSQYCSSKWSFEIALVADDTKALNDALVKSRVQRRLVSYFELKNLSPAKLNDFFGGYQSERKLPSFALRIDTPRQRCTN